MIDLVETSIGEKVEYNIHPNSRKMQEDVAKYKHKNVSSHQLLALIEARPQIYNITLKDHNNQEVLHPLWKEISKELNASVTECKAKWHSLRTSYARYLRDLKITSAGSAARKKNWYLASSMNFLQKYVVPHKKMINNLTSTRNVAHRAREQQQEENEIIITDLRSESPEFESKVLPLEEIRPHKKIKQTVADVVAEPMPVYLKAVTENRNQEDDPMAIFFKSLLPDVKKLDPRRQRNFKANILLTLNNLLDEQEDLIITHPPSQSSVCSEEM